MIIDNTLRYLLLSLMFVVKKITVLLLSCFGIGFIPYVSGILASFFATTIRFFPVQNINEIIFLGIPALIILFLPLNYYFSNKMKGEQKIIVLPKVIGTWLALSSQVIAYTTPWILISLSLFLVLSLSRTKFDNFLIHKTKIWNKLTKDILSGAAALIVLHAVYAGYLIYPFISAYLEKQLQK